MRKGNIGLVVRIYDETGGFYEIREDNLPHEIIPDEMMKCLMARELCTIQLSPNVKAFYFAVPSDWPKNWTTDIYGSELQYPCED